MNYSDCIRFSCTRSQWWVSRFGSKARAVRVTNYDEFQTKTCLCITQSDNSVSHNADIQECHALYIFIFLYSNSYRGLLSSAYNKLTQLKQLYFIKLDRSVVLPCHAKRSDTVRVNEIAEIKAVGLLLSKGSKVKKGRKWFPRIWLRFKLIQSCL